MVFLSTFSLQLEKTSVARYFSGSRAAMLDIGSGDSWHLHLLDGVRVGVRFAFCVAWYPLSDKRFR